MKAFFSVVVTVLLLVAHKLATPFVAMQAQDVAVNQMNGTDASTAAVQYIGNGTSLLDSGCFIVWVLLMVIIWRSAIKKAIKNRNENNK